MRNSSSTRARYCRTVSQENVEVVRRSVEAYLRGDVAASFADATSDVVWNPVEAGELQGYEQVRAYFAEWEDVWDDYDMEAEEIRALGTKVVVTFRFRGRGKGSGVPIDQRTYNVYTVRDGKIMRVDEYADRAALEAAGLSQ
jgi:ketosteroid isomerase-like protein